MKRKRVTFQLSDKAMKVLNPYRQSHSRKSMSDCINDLIIAYEIKTKGSLTRTTEERIERKVTETFNYEKFEKMGVDCRFGSYLPLQRKVLCLCPYPSVIKAGLGKGRLIDPWICEAHFNSKAFQSTLAWVDKKQKEREQVTQDTKRYDGKIKYGAGPIVRY